MNADADTDAAHIMAEIRTFRRRLDELTALAEGGLDHDPAVSKNGAPADSGWELDSREKILQEIREVVEETTTFRQVTFRDISDIRIRLEANPQGFPLAALLEKRGEKGWSSNPMDPQDAEDLEWLLSAIEER